MITTPNMWNWEVYHVFRAERTFYISTYNELTNRHFPRKAKEHRYIFSCGMLSKTTPVQDCLDIPVFGFRY